MSNSQPHEALFLPFGDVEFNDAGDVVKIALRRKKNANYEGENGRKVADAIVGSPALKEISLWGCYCDDASSNRKTFAAVFGRERTHPCALEEFDACELNLGPGDLVVMLPFLKSTPEIKTFSLHTNKLGDEGTRLLSEVLDHTRIEYLNLCGSEIRGEDLGRLFSSKNSKHLHKLDLECNDIGALGQEAICRFLQRDDTEMRELYFDFVDQNRFRTVLESISPRSKLVALFDDKEEGGDRDDLDDDSTTAMSRMLRNVVCNTDTLESLCESNHQLIWVGDYTCHLLNSVPILKKTITINNQLAHGASIISRIRSKLRTFYFQGQFDVQPFIDMNIVFMPFVLELVTRTERVFPTDDNYGSGRFSDLTGGECVTLNEGDLGSVYHLVRNCHLPELFTFPSSESRIVSLEEEIARLTVENEELRSQLGRP